MSARLHNAEEAEACLTSLTRTPDVLLLSEKIPLDENSKNENEIPAER